MPHPSATARARFEIGRAMGRVLRPMGLTEPAARWRILRARTARRKAEAAGDDRLSRPALHGLEDTLDALFGGRRGGFFVEAGGHDGFTQSNTYWLERFRGWRGFLIEPIPELFALCRAERPTAFVLNAALVGPDHDGATVRMQFGDLMSTVSGTHGDDEDWVAPGLALGWSQTYAIDVPARTLSSVLEEFGAPEVDLLSLDVEGFEEPVLRGLDLERHAPRFLLVEMHDLEEGRRLVGGLLGERYVEHAQPTPLDVIYRRADVTVPDAGAGAGA